MNTLKRKLTAILLTFAMLFSLMPALPQAAEAATAQGQSGYVTLSYENNGAINDKTITVHVMLNDTEVDSFSISDAKTADNHVSITVNDTSKYVIGMIVMNRDFASTMEDTLQSWSCLADGNSEINVYLVDKEDPVAPNGVQTGSHRYRLDDAQIDKLLYLQTGEQLDDINVTGIDVNFKEKHGALSEQIMNPDPADGSWYIDLSYSPDLSHTGTGSPYNIESITIEYNEKETTIPAEGLRFVLQDNGNYTIESSNDNVHVLYFYNQEDGFTHYSLYAKRYVNDGDMLGEVYMPKEPIYGNGNAYEFVNWTIEGTETAFYSNTRVYSDMNLYAKKVSSAEAGGIYIHVMNETDDLLNRIVEVYNAEHGTAITVDDIQKDSMRMKANDSDGKTSTNPDYIGNGWKEDNTYFLINNPSASGAVGDTQNDHVGYNTIESVTVYFFVENDSEKTLTIPVGQNAGELSKVMIDGQSVLELSVIDPPTPPTFDQLEGEDGILGTNAVTVHCTTNTSEHQDITTGLLADSYSVSEKATWKKINGKAAYYVDVTVEDDKYVENYNDSYKGHAIDGAGSQTITLKWTGSAWTPVADTPVTFEVKCENAKNITEFNKEVLTQDEIKAADITGTYDNPTDKDGKVVVKEGESATLLYKITVKGDPGAAFKVQDTGATLVKATGVELDTETKDVFEGNIDAQGTDVVLYVSKTFENITTTAPLKNEASVTSTTGDYPDDPKKVEVDVQIVPEEPDVVKLLGDAAVKVDCVNPNVGHGDKDPVTYGLLNGTYELKPSEDGLHYTVTITNAQAYVDKYNETLEGHELVAGPEGEISLNYKGNGEWEIPGAPLLIKVTCPEVHSVDTFEKSIVTRAEAEDAAILNEANQNTYTFPDDKGKVTVKEGDTATLLYKFVVEGTPNTKFTVQEDVHTTFVMAKGATITVNEDGNYEGTIPASEKAVFYVSKTFKDIPLNQETLDNTATIVNNSTPDKVPGDGTTTENVPVTVEPLGAFTKTLITQNNIDTLPDAVKSRNDIVFPALNEDGTVETVIVPKDGSVTLLYAIKVEGEEGDKFTVTDKGADLVDANGYDVTESNEEDTFTGTVDKSGGVIFYVSRTFTSDDVKGDKLVNSAQIESDDIDVKPGDEEQEEGVPAEVGEGLIVTVKPADVTSYEGGDGGYDGVVDEDNSEVEGENSPSLPHPMFYIDAPEDVDPAGLTFVNGDKVWTVKEDGLDGDETNPRMLYHFVEGAEQEPVRVTYTYVNHQTGVETTVTSDNLDELENVADVYTYLRIDLYAGENDLSDVKASINGTSYAIKAESGQLTVRAVEADNPSDVTSDIQATAPVEDGTADTAVAVEPANTTYTFNDTEVELPEDSNPSLLFDNIIDDSVNRTAALEAKADQKLNADADDYNYEIMYLDLVDTNNGNAWITSSEGTDIYWDYPEGTDRNTDFEILHFTGLHREDSETTDSGFEIEDLESISMDEIENVTIKEKTDDYIVFHVTEANFSPYAIAWETDNGGSDTPGGDTPGGNDPWYPPYNPGDDDKPSGLNTEDHFSYVVGYEDGMVKPQRSITRAEVATIFYRLLEDDVRDDYDTTRNNFSDVTSDSWYNQTVSTLASMGILKGYEDGTFRPNASITRAEFAAIATRFFEETGATYEPGTFTDVTGREWFAGAIMDAVNLGLIGGYEDGTVRPNNNITRAEACAIVNRTLGRVPDADHLLPDDVMKTWPDNPESAWFYADMQEATNGHEYEWITEDGNKIEEWTDILDKDWNDR